MHICLHWKYKIFNFTVLAVKRYGFLVLNSNRLLLNRSRLLLLLCTTRSSFSNWLLYILMLCNRLSQCNGLHVTFMWYWLSWYNIIMYYTKIIVHTTTTSMGYLCKVLLQQRRRFNSALLLKIIILLHLNILLRLLQPSLLHIQPFLLRIIILLLYKLLNNSILLVRVHTGILW